MGTYEKKGELIIENGFVKDIITIDDEKGYIYKDMEKFHKKQGLCYMGECAIDEALEAIENGILLTEYDLIDLGYGVDYNTCIESLDSLLSEYNIKTENVVLEKIAEEILNSCEWQHFATELYSIPIISLEHMVRELESKINNQ